MALVSTCLTCAFIFLCVELYLHRVSPVVQDNWLDFTIRGTDYSTQYIFWDKPYCQFNPKDCKYPEEHLLSYPVELFQPSSTTQCSSYYTILFLGDSFTAAPWTRPGQSYAAIFAQDYAEHHQVCVKMLRAATGGVGSDQELAYFSDHVAQLHPDMVIWQFCYNDTYENDKQAIYDVKNGRLVKLNLLRNSTFLAGFLNQHLPFLHQTLIGQNLLWWGSERDVLRTWPTIMDTDHISAYNTLKIPLEIQAMKQLSVQHHFQLFTTLAPLECYLTGSIECTGDSLQMHNLIKKLAQQNSRFINMSPQVPLDLQETSAAAAKTTPAQFLSTASSSAATVLGTTDPTWPVQVNNGATPELSEELFNTTQDANPPGIRHLSVQGNAFFGQILFNNYLNTATSSAVSLH